MPSKKGKDDALVFAPPPLALRRIDDLCYHLDATDRRDRNEIAKAFNDAGGALEISNFMPASTIMCWWQDRAAGDLWLGMRIDQQGVAFPDRIVPLGYTYGAPTTYSSSTVERLPGENWQNALSYEARHGRTKRRRSSTSRGGKNGESPSSKLPKYT
ncbi:hypothetical protein FOZ60_011218 [Perkinsus olseni]|uniref:Uncharacterized protein n=1 Tax=Perkinsus olseni TaxID=32597 RepID=A0A7J6NDQ3_PEROL|nr:hypothetical protein FOZ60_011218 [Perkinsus olseni]